MYKITILRSYFQDNERIQAYQCKITITWPKSFKSKHTGGLTHSALERIKMRSDTIILD